MNGPTRIILLRGMIDRETANEVCAQLLILGSEDPTADINLYIDSPGGSVNDGLAIYDTMKYTQADVATWVPRYAAGFAQVVLSGGTPGKRYALPGALIRMAWAERADDTSPITDQALGAAVREIAQRVSEDTGQSVRQIARDADQERQFTAQEALQYGLIDWIVPALPTSFGREE